MNGAGFLFSSGFLFLVVGGVILAYPGGVPSMSAVSPRDIESDPEAAAAKARGRNQLRGLLAVGLGVAFIIGGITSTL